MTVHPHLLRIGFGILMDAGLFYGCVHEKDTALQKRKIVADIVVDYRSIE